MRHDNNAALSTLHGQNQTPISGPALASKDRIVQAQSSLSIRQIHEFLLNVATSRPVFIWGPPGVGKSSLVEQFAQQLGLECVALLGSQLAPEDLIGIPQIDGAVSRFFPPAMIVRDREFVLFIDELNIASTEIQKA